MLNPLNPLAIVGLVTLTHTVISFTLALGIPTLNLQGEDKKGIKVLILIPSIQRELEKVEPVEKVGRRSSGGKRIEI